MKEASFIIELGIVLAAALAGGLLARILRLPVLVGYLAAGVAVGPYTPGHVADVDLVPAIANVGVVLLMFAVGAQFSLRELASVRRTAVLGGIIQIAGTIALGVLVAALAGWSWVPGLFLGCALALSSTAVSMRLLEERGELGSTHGAIVLGIAVVQDLSLVVMVSLLPSIAALAAPDPGTLAAVGLGLLRAAGFIAVTLLLATRLIPLLFDRVIKTGSQELFLLTTVCLAFSSAVAAEKMRLGMALGAFLAGIVMSESPYSHEVLHQVRPLRDVFAAIFFVSIGMLLDPSYVVENWGFVLLVVAAVLFGKGLLTAIAVRVTGWHARTALFAAAGLANIGEFSFVLANEGSARGLIGPDVGRTVVSTALVTIFAAPFLYAQAGRVYYALTKTKGIRRLLHGGAVEHGPAGARRPHPRVLVLGGGRVGRYTSEALARKDVEHLIIDYDSDAIRRAKDRGIPVLYGDATSPVVLARIKPERAELAIVALPEAAVTEMAVKALRRLAPNLPVIVRVRRGADIPRMRAAGANSVVHGEFESGVEMIRQSLSRLGFDDDSVDKYVQDIRDHTYRH